MNQQLAERIRKDYMDREEVAEYLGRTTRTISNMTLRGDLQAYKMPTTAHKHWFARAEVESLCTPKPVKVQQSAS